jgi:hypothetical protein
VADKPKGTLGGVVSEVELLTVTLTAALVAALPAASFAIARKECDPLLAVNVLHDIE